MDWDNLIVIADSAGKGKQFPPEPWLTLDDDICNSLLQHMRWYEDFKQQVVDETAEQVAVEKYVVHFRQQLDFLYMETIWRIIQKKKAK
jgi:hypothetical protein